MGYNLNLNDMIRKGYSVECDWCGMQEYYDTIKSISKFCWLYRLKKINPLADELYFKNKGHKPFKYLVFCCEDCKNSYFEESPEDIPHYKKVGNYNPTEEFGKIWKDCIEQENN